MDRAPSSTSLNRAIAIAGSQSGLAKLLGVSQMAVSRWSREVSPLPGEFVIPIETATGISRHDLRPDLYPRESATSTAPSGSAPLEVAR